MLNIKRVGIDKKGTISIQDLIALAKQNSLIEESGAIATFTGIVRGYTHEGEKVEKLELEAYKEVAEKALEEISNGLRTKPGITDVLIHLLVGTFSVGEEIVYVVVVGKSRNEVFSTLVEAVERYKHEVPMWKKEYMKDGRSYWVSEK